MRLTHRCPATAEPDGAAVFYIGVRWSWLAGEIARHIHHETAVEHRLLHPVARSQFLDASHPASAAIGLMVFWRPIIGRWCYFLVRTILSHWRGRGRRSRPCDQAAGYEQSYKFNVGVNHFGDTH